jgi:hypothetical protein
MDMVDSVVAISVSMLSVVVSGSPPEQAASDAIIAVDKRVFDKVIIGSKVDIHFCYDFDGKYVPLPSKFKSF